MTPIGTVSWSAEEGFVVSAARLEAPYPCALRMAKYPDGSLRVQGAYSWTQGSEGGLLWRDLPVVAVDEAGRERGGT